MSQNIYYARTFCKNCGDTNNTEIEKGNAIDSVACRKCNLKTLVRDKLTEGERRDKDAKDQRLVKEHRGW